MNRPSIMAPINKQSNKMINDNLKSEMIRHFMSQVKTEDLLNVAFMKPVEVTLRTNKTDKAVPVESLPAGLMLVVKENGINDNKYKLQRFKPVASDVTSLDALKEMHMDNYISLLKHSEEEAPPNLKQQYVDEVRMSQAEQASKEGKKHKGHEFGICVSMCKQDKRTLKKTMVGVAQNVDELVRSGVCPDDIFVVVMIDGIQNVDKSLYEYFQEFQRESETFLEQDDVLTMKKKYENYLYHQEIEKEEPLNFTKFLFKPEQFANRIESKFPHVRAKYDEVCRIKKSIQNIKKEHNKDNDNLKMILNKMIDKQKDILKKIKSEKKVLINEESIMKELANSQEECNQYITTRDTLAYVSAYRLRTSSLCTDLKDLETKQTMERSSMIEGQFETQRMYDEELMEKSRGEQGNLTENRLIKKTIKYVNLFFCVKYKEAGKLSSHNWFFNGFCQEFNPKYTVIIDVGVRPYPDAIFKMYRCMKLNDRVGSVCGYMRLVQQKVEDEEMTKPQDMDCLSQTLVNVFDIQRAQLIQKHFEHLVEKPFESVFKFIHVLPGAFSAYNMDALRPRGQNDQLLRSYFSSIDEKLSKNKVIPSNFAAKEILGRVLLPKTLWKCTNKVDPDSQEQLLYNQNVNLAEDRILCLGIHKNDRDIVFMPDVYAQAQPIKMINNLMGEKKRQINGGAYSFEKVRQQFSHKDNEGSIFLIRFQLLYLSFNKFLSYFAPAILVYILQFTFEIIQTEFLADLFSKQSKTGIGNVIYGTITTIIVFCYALLMFSMVFFSLHLDYKSKKFMYYAYLVTTILGIFSMLCFIVFLAQTIQGFVGSGDYLRKRYFTAVEKLIPGRGLLFVNGLRYFLGGAVFVLVFPILIYSIFFRKFGILWDVFVGFFSYIFYFPTYATVIPIYSKCRLDDISSATIGNLGSRSQKLKQTWKILKLINVAKYFFWNAIVSVTLIILSSYLLIKFFSLLFFLMLFTIMQLVKLVPVLIYTISYKCSMLRNPLKPTDQEISQNSLHNEFRVFNAIKRLEEDLRIQIQYSFELASEDLEYQQELKKQSELQKQEAKKNQKETPKPKRLESQYHLSRQSIKIMNNFQGNKFTNIRQSSAIKGSFYPMQFGKKEQVGPSAAQQTTVQTPLEMVLLKQQIGQQALGSTQMKAGEQKLKQFEIFRGTMARPVIKN